MRDSPNAVSRRRSASTATAAETRHSTMPPALPGKRPSARRSAAVSASRGARSRSWVARSRESGCRGGPRPGRRKFARARSTSRCRTRRSSQRRSAWSPTRMLEPLYTAPEMRAAEERYPGSVDELMERAGRAVAEHALEDFGDARSYTIVCGGGSNGGDGRVAARVLEQEGRDVLVVEAKPEDEEKDLGDPDVVVD